VKTAKLVPCHRLSQGEELLLPPGTPTFADKPTPGVRHSLRILHEEGIPMRIAKAGDRLTAGDVVMEVLHPPPAGPDGNENARSLVLLVRHAGHSILLTGDLEGRGLFL
jgi:competence protein ComEC